MIRACHRPSLARPAVRAALVTVLAILVAGPTSAQRPFTPEDMLGVVQISGSVAVSPDGTRYGYVLPNIVDEWNVGARVQYGTVHVMTLAEDGTRRQRRVGRRGQPSSLPVFSPDGRHIAVHLEGPAGGQLGVWDLESEDWAYLGAHYSGAAWQQPEWAGAGRVVYQRPEATEPPAPPARVTVMESTDETLPGDAFFRRDRSAGLALVDLAAGTEQALVADGSALARFSVSPDGAYALIDQLENGPRTALVSLEDEAPARLSRPGERLSWIPDGRLVWRRGDRLLATRPDRLASEAAVLMEPLDEAITSMAWAPGGTRFASLVADPSITDPEIEEPRPGMYTIARPFTDLRIYAGPEPESRSWNVTADLPDRVGSPVWSGDGRWLYFVATDNERYDEGLFRLDTTNGELREISRGRESFGPLIPVPGGVVASIQTATSPGDLWRIDGDTGARTRITDLNPELADVAFAEPELFHFESRVGERLGGLLFRPPGAASDVPVVMYVYEKLTPGIHRFQARQQIFATHGYAVVMPNVKVRVGETATSFVDSTVPALAAVEAMGFTNGRACLWGGSFGAYATSFVITQTDVFDCAVSRATPPELFRNWASGRDRDSDNIERGQARMGGSPFEFPERYLSQSAFFHLDRVETPVLITHGQQDFTILHEEGAMMFYALRRLGKEATFVSYRDGDHSLYRHSREDFLDVHRRMLEWFDRHLRR